MYQKIKVCLTQLYYETIHFNSNELNEPCCNEQLTSYGIYARSTFIFVQLSCCNSKNDGENNIIQIKVYTQYVCLCLCVYMFIRECILQGTCRQTEHFQCQKSNRFDNKRMSRSFVGLAFARFTLLDLIRFDFSVVYILLLRSYRPTDDMELRGFYRCPLLSIKSSSFRVFLLLLVDFAIIGVLYTVNIFLFQQQHKKQQHHQLE